MNHFVVYHNAETMGYDAREVRRFAIVTTKSTTGVIGSRIWLIAGRGSPRSYSLVQTFVAEKAGPSQESTKVNEVLASTGKKFRPEIALNHMPWFPAFKKTMGNFGLGLQRITSTEFINALETLRADGHVLEEGMALDHHIEGVGREASTPRKRRPAR